MNFKKFLLICLLCCFSIINVKALSNNNYLKSLEITDYNINFNKEVYEYTVEVKNDTSLEINAIAEDDKSSVEINNNYNLKNGSKIRIIVTSEDTTQRIYTINIINKKK